MTALFSLHTVTYAYGSGDMVLRDVSTDFQQGERSVILGANGTGKSTLLSLLDGLIFPTSGSISVFDRLLTEKTLEDRTFAEDFRKRVAFVFSNPDVQLFSSSVWDEIAFGPLQLGFSPAEIRDVVERQLETLRITELRDRAPHTLSDGQKKKVAIASVLATQPDLLILDEPLLGLDRPGILSLVKVIEKVRRTGRAIMIIEQLTGHIIDVIDRAAILHNGKIVREGEPGRVFSGETEKYGVRNPWK